MITPLTLKFKWDPVGATVKYEIVQHLPDGTTKKATSTNPKRETTIKLYEGVHEVTINDMPNRKSPQKFVLTEDLP